MRGKIQSLLLPKISFELRDILEPVLASIIIGLESGLGKHALTKLRDRFQGEAYRHRIMDASMRRSAGTGMG